MQKPFALTLAALTCAVSLFTLANAQQSDPQTLATSSLSNAKQVALAMLMYAQDYDEMFPYGKTMAEVKPKVMPYIKNKTLFIDPTSGKEFMYNPVMGGMALQRIKEPANAVLFHSPVVHTDGMFTIAYVDGHCKRQSKIPNLVFAQTPSKIHKAAIRTTKPARKKR